MPLQYDPSRIALYSPGRRETLFQSGQTYSPVQLAIEAARLAYVRAEVSEEERLRLIEALARVQFGTPELFADSRTGTEAFAAHRSSDGATLLVFRGTQPGDMADLATDLQAHTVAWPESAGRVHAGFAAAIRTLIPRLREWIGDTQPDRTELIIAGHSLGGALATLAATIWSPGLLVTLGSPRVGDANFAATLTTTSVIRLVNCCDVVTELPPPIGGYTHVKPRTYLTRDGDVIENPADDLVATDRQRARIEYVTREAWKSGAVLLRDLADHAPINYARAFFP